MLEFEGVSAMWFQSRKTINKFADGLLTTLAMIRQGYLKKGEPLLACKIWTTHLKMPATPYSNVHLQLVLF